MGKKVMGFKWFSRMMHPDMTVRSETGGRRLRKCGVNESKAALLLPPTARREATWHFFPCVTLSSPGTTGQTWAHC